MQSYETSVVGEVRTPVLILFSAVALVLLIAGANVANLMLLRGEGRRADFAVRTALGASRQRLIRQVLVESAALGVIAAAAALTFTAWALDAVIAWSPLALPRAANVGIDARVFAFAAIAGIAAATLASLVASLVTSRMQLPLELRGTGSRTTSGGSRRGRRVLVIAQVALAVVIVAAAGVLTRTLLHLQSLEMGMATERLVFVELSLPGDEYPADRRRPFFAELIAQLRGSAGIEAVTPIITEPYAGLAGWTVPRVAAEGQSEEEAAGNPGLNLESIHPEHFETLNIRILQGRGVQAGDVKDLPLVTVVSDDVARKLWPGGDPIGRRIKMGNLASPARWFTVVGVSEPVRYRQLEEPAPTMYVAAAQFIDSAASLAVRTASPVSVIAEVVRDRVRAVDPDVRVLSIDPFSTFLARPLARPRFVALLTNAFGSIALLLAAIGLYGVLAAFVRMSMREIGVRIALGATARHVRRLVIGEAARLAGIGIALGLAGAFATAQLLRGIVFGVEPVDPMSLAAAIALLIVTTAIACYLPIRRATRVDAVQLLRS